MKIIEALKSIKQLQVKSADLRVKIQTHCAALSIETPVYPDQKGHISKWLQAHEDTTREIADLCVRVQKTNIATMVAISIGGKTLTKTIAEWIVRRRLTSGLDLGAWAQLSDRNLKEGAIPSTQGGELTKVTIQRFYDPVQRDEKVALYKSEPNAINVAMETVNATIDLLD